MTISICFPKQICGHLQLDKDGWRRRKEYNSVWVSSVFRVVWEFLRSIFARKNVRLYWKKISKMTFYSIQRIFLIIVDQSCRDENVFFPVYFIEQIDSILACVCSVNQWHTRLHLVCIVLTTFWRHLWSITPFAVHLEKTRNHLH